MRDLSEDITRVNLPDYQPSIEQVQAKINKSTRTSYWVRNTVDFLTVAAVVTYSYNKWFKGAKKTA